MALRVLFTHNYYLPMIIFHRITGEHNYYLGHCSFIDYHGQIDRAQKRDSQLIRFNIVRSIIYSASRLQLVGLEVAASIVAPILDDIGEKSSSFISFSVRCIPRDSNTMADLCAKQACSLLVSDCWLEGCPSVLLRSLRADCNHMLTMQ